MSAKQPNMSLFTLIVSIIILIYLFFVVIPYGEQYNFFSEGSGPQEDKVLSFFFMTTPIYIGYLIYIFKSSEKVTYLYCLNFPLTFFNIYVFLFICFTAVTGGAILWLMVITAIFPIILIPVSFAVGLKKDINYLMKKK